jgi:inhibitor of KinA
MATSSGVEARFVPASDQSLLVYFDSAIAGNQTRITRGVHEQVRRFVRLLELEPISGVRNLHPGYCSVLVNFDAVKLRHEQVREQLAACINRMDKVALPEPRDVEIPVCYGGEFGPDLM